MRQVNRDVLKEEENIIDYLMKEESRVVPSEILTKELQ